MRRCVGLPEGLEGTVLRRSSLNNRRPEPGGLRLEIGVEAKFLAPHGRTVQIRVWCS